MFKKAGDEDLFLNDTGSLSQNYDKDQHFDASRVNLYDDDDADIRIPPIKMASNEAYSDDRIYDDFELATKPNDSKPADSLPKTRNDAPWLNREKVPDNDATRLLEYERSFKNDQFHDPPYPPRTQKPYPKEIETQAKSARSLQRKQNKFDENYSKWAYDDEYDNEDKSDKDASLYDPDNNHDESGRSSRLFSQSRFANPENPFSELLDENYPNVGDLPPYKVGKIRVENKLEEKLKASLKEPRTPGREPRTPGREPRTPGREPRTPGREPRTPGREPRTPGRATKSEDDDVIILDDSLPISARIRNEVNKNIKISFTSEPKSKSAQETLFAEEHVSRDPRIQKKEEAAQSAKKIPILEGSSIPTIAPNVRPITPGAPIISQAAPLAPFSNPPFPMLDRNYYNVFGGNVMNEMHANRNFIPGANVAEFFSTTAMQFNPSVGWIPLNPQASAPPPAAAVVEKAPPTAKDAGKAEKVHNEDAVKEEIRQQNKKLMDQRDQYLQKFNSLNEELSKLKKQKKSLSDKKTHQAEEFLRENDKLQTEILSKIKAVKNVIDMLSKIIKDEGMKGSSSDTADEGSKKSSVELDDNAKEAPRSKRKHSRSRSKSRHRSRSKSRHRSRSKSRHRSRSRSRGRRSRSRSRGRRSRSRSRYRRRSRSRDYYRRRRSNSRDRKKSKRDKEEKKPTTTPAPAAVPTPAPAPAASGVTLITVVEPPPIPAPVVETKPAPVVEKPKPKEPKLSDRFKSSFEEIYDRPVPPPKLAEAQKPPPVASNSRFSDEPKSVLGPAPPPAREKPKPAKQPEAAKGWARNTADSINYVYFDPEIHWCRVCNAFPKTAKEYLLHLHSAEHKQVLATNNLIDYPWHKNQTDTKKPTNPGAPTERIPIRGLPFFVSASAWYCKLCDQWMGDLHCASAHLKSDLHESNYMTFLESNPKWEEHWMDSRAKALKAQHVVKAPEPVTPAYSSETYIKPAPIPPPPPPLQLRPGTGEKKRSSSTSSSSSSSSTSSSSSSGRSSHKKKKKSKRKRSKSKDRKRSVEKETKFKMVVTDAKKARELAKLSHVVAPPPQPEPASAPTQGTVSFNVEEEDKFVQEWMNPARSKSKEKDLQELKKKLIKNREPPVLPALPPEKPKPAADPVAKKPPSKGKSPERDRSRRDDDHRSGSDRGSDRSGRSRFEDRSRRSPRDDRYKKSNGSDSKSSDRYRSSFDRSRDSKSGGSGPKKTIIDRRFPFIGKMPSKNSLKKTAAEQHADSKSKPEKKPEKVEPVPADPSKPKDPLTESIQKQLAEYDRPNDVNVAVVDMDINEDEDEPAASIVVDDNISRKKDFDETLKLLYPENRAKSGSGDKNQTSQAASAVLPANLSQDYLVSLIKSTIKENQLNLKDGNENSQIMQIASSMKELLAASTTNLADIPIPLDERPVHISSEEQLYNVPLPDEPETSGVELEPEPAPPGTVDSDSGSSKKKKNPISQKKRRHMRKIREKLEEQEKLLQQKIEERTGGTGQNEPEVAEGDVSVTSSNAADEARNEVQEAYSTPRPAPVIDNDLMMLGIDEEDSAALLF